MLRYDPHVFLLITAQSRVSSQTCGNGLVSVTRCSAIHFQGWFIRQYRPFKARVLGDLVSLPSPRLLKLRGDAVDAAADAAATAAAAAEASSSNSSTAGATAAEAPKEAAANASDNSSTSTPSNGSSTSSSSNSSSSNSSSSNSSSSSSGFIFLRGAQPANLSLGFWVSAPPLNGSRFIYRPPLSL
ncbi:hypothetical protein, conserved [Eimeria tenella]|uniref:Uncharacterized protein n=1 Tax=Eimeria tenella TaxID=5802 RepID=U6L0D7_EIMTE|nr:hypothetical protein, conserved [Eimeria tenella]CDJ42648.1 hypothetical protein, conserved [Eimeria tenella]|eukprot:XP_013233398.1 hypothetical protein, conserved [Eimeria tenella]